MKDSVKERILQATRNGLDIFNYYLPHDLPSRGNFKSPFYANGSPSCNVFEGKDGTWWFKDFAVEKGQSGDCFWFVGELKGYTQLHEFPKILSTIIHDLSLSIDNPRVPQMMINPTAEYSYVKKEYTDKELNYWQYYGITKAILRQYKVYSLRSFDSYSSNDGEQSRINSSESEPIFMYDKGTSVKVFRPFSQHQYLHKGTLSDGYAFGFEQLPMKGDMVFIVDGEKDVLSLAVRGFHAISFSSETTEVDATVIQMLKRRFKHIFLCISPRNKRSNCLLKALSAFKILHIDLPSNEKDVSDYFAVGGTRDGFGALVFSVLEQNLYIQTQSLLKSCEIDLANPPEESKSVITIGKTILGSYDNLLCITGGEGTGKSNFVSALISGAISGLALLPTVTLGVEVSDNPDSKAVIHYDTEQSEAQLYKNIKRTLKRTGFSNKPDYYYSLCLTAFSRRERLQLIQDSMDMYYHRHGGIHLVVIDGVADLIRSANDEIESVAIIEELYRLAGIYNTCIVCVLHLTPGGLKLRGHLGSELQRKAAGILSIEKDRTNESLSVIKAIKVRDGE